MRTVEVYGLKLILPPGLVTWEARGAISIIDLVFITTPLLNRLIEYRVAEELDFGSDYYPISTRLYFDTI